KRDDLMQRCTVRLNCKAARTSGAQPAGPCSPGGRPKAAGSSSPPSGVWTAETTATPCELSLAIVFARPVGGVSASVILNRPSPPNSEPRTDSDPVYLESTMRIATCPSEYQLVRPPRYTGPDPNPNVPVESAA